MTIKIPPRIGKGLRIVVSLVLIFWLLSRFDLKGVMNAVTDLRFLVWVQALFLYIAAQALSSARWWRICRVASFSGTWPLYLRYYFAGMFFNLFLPTGLGGDVYKVHLLFREEGRALAGASTILWDRSFGLAAMLLIGAATVCLRPELLPRPLVMFLWISGLVALAALLMLPLAFRFLRRYDLSGASNGSSPAKPTLLQRVTPLLTLGSRHRDLLILLGLSLAIQGTGMAIVAMIGSGMGIQVSSLFYLASIPLITLVTILPISVSGIGVREGAFVYLFGLEGVHPEPALALGLLYFSVQVAASLLGGLFYVRGLSRGNTAIFRSRGTP